MFPHLELPKKIDGLYKSKKGRGSKEIDPITQFNLNNRGNHARTLLANTKGLSDYWKNNIDSRVENNLPKLPNSNILPVFLKIDPEKFDIESLKSFGIEIIAEEEGGYIIGASSSDFKSLEEKIQKFTENNAKAKFKNKASQLWDINSGIQWRIEKILSEELQIKWASIQDNDNLIVDMGIACYVKRSPQPKKKKSETDEKFKERLLRWEGRYTKTDEQREDLARERQDAFERLVQAYNGELPDGFIDFGDSYCCRVVISGKGFKDIVLNYQYLFEVVEYDPFITQNESTGEIENVNPELIAPEADFPKVCVIDSGIQEEHKLLSLAIDSGKSISFIQSDRSTADVGGNGGHGTRVAGAVLYPDKIPRNGTYSLPCFIQNARVLVQNNGRVLLPKELYPPKLMEKIVDHFNDTRIFNMSINSSVPCHLNHMSQWASAIDKISFEKDILFILSVGNIATTTPFVSQPGIIEHLIANRNYPKFLLEKSSRISDPAQSCFALSVGSVCLDKFDNGIKESFGEKDQPSSFSRTGLGLWGMIKPDVVEYGGDFTKEKNASPLLSREASISPELIRSTINGGTGVGNDDIGTSFAAPKVAHIAAMLQRFYPNESVNLYRALIAQSARLPDAISANPSFSDLQHYGYGIPNLKRATENSEKRVTLIASDTISASQAKIYSVKIPSEINTPGEDYDVLIEITLSFVAATRRTRMRTNSYLSTWLDWESSKFNENDEQFKTRIIKDMDNNEEGKTDDQNSIKWVIREKRTWSKIPGIRRQDSSLQKSWCTIKSYDLPDTLSFAVIGHKGWENDLSEEVPYSIAVSFEAINSNINIYESIQVENEISIPVEIEQEVIE